MTTSIRTNGDPRLAAAPVLVIAWRRSTCPGAGPSELDILGEAERSGNFGSGEQDESASADDQRAIDESAPGEEDVDEGDEVAELAAPGAKLYQSSTNELVNRLIRRLSRTRRCETEADPAHLLEAIAVIVYEPNDGLMLADIPAPGTGLRWDEFVATVADQYDVRFED